MSSTDNNQDPTPKSTAASSSSPAIKLRKIPQIPIQRTSHQEPAKNVDGSRSSSDEDSEDEDDDDDFGNYHYGKNDLYERNMGSEDDSSILLASTLGLNHIRTRSTPLPSPLRFSSSAGTPSNIGNVGSSKTGNVANKEKLKVGIEAYTSDPNIIPIDQGADHLISSR